MHKLLKHKSRPALTQALRVGATVCVAAIVCLAETGCSLFPNCAEYSWFQDRVQDCVDQDVSCFSQTYSSAQLTGTVQLAKNNLLYKYDLNAPPAYDGDNYHSCKIDLTVDANSGKMISGSWNGDCDYWSRCARYE